MSAIEMNASDAMLSLTVRVRGLKVLGLRCWLAGKLFALAGIVAGCNLVIEGEWPTP